MFTRTDPRRWVKAACIVFTLSMFAGFGYAGLAQTPGFVEVLTAFFTVYVFVAACRTLGLLGGALLYRYRKYVLAKKAKGFQPYVSIIVPAFNEGDVLAKALDSLFDLNYPNYEILVINDGSTDNTLAIAQHACLMNPHVPSQVITQVNGGKASALNTGISIARGDLCMCVDADSKLSRDSLIHGVKHFIDHRVGAISGFVQIAAPDTFLLRCQDLEYSIALNFTRPALALSGAVTIVPGPCGLFRKDALASVRGYDSDKGIFAEDADLTIRLLADGWRVSSEDKMISYTEGPDHLTDVFRQRYRWNRGILQAVNGNLRSLGLRSGLRGKFILSYLLFDVYVIRTTNFALTIFFLTTFIATGGTHLFTLWILFLIALDMIVVAFTAKSLPQFMRNLVLLTFMKATYSYMLTTWGVLCLFEEWASVKMSWDKLTRTGHLQQEETA